jgi:hypothetical protein
VLTQRRQQGSIRKRGNSFRVLVYAGLDPLSGKRVYLDESTTDEAEAQRILNRLRAEVDAQRHARTNATLGYAIGEWLRVHELEDTTLEGYEMYVRRYIQPAQAEPAAGEPPVSRTGS